MLIYQTNVLMTPQLANEMLQKKRPNRPVSHSLVDAYKSDMLAGKWRRNGDTIRQDEEGFLIDGEHRLTAIAEAGVSIHCDLVTGVSLDSRHTIDRGRKRSFSDHLVLQDVPHAKLIARTLTAISMARKNVKRSITIDEAEEQRQEFAQELNWFINKVEALSDEEKENAKFMLNQARIYGALVYAYKFAPDKVNSFFDEVRTATGSFAQLDAPVRKFRDYCMTLSRKKNGNLFWITLAAVYRHIHDMPMTKISEASEAVREYFQI